MSQTLNINPGEAAGPQHRYLFVAWAGQLLSMLTLAATNFGLGVWAYQHSGSITQFSSVILFGILPGILIAPWAGVVVDRHHKRTVIVAADLALMAGASALALLLWADLAGIWHFYAFNALASVCSAFRSPAYFAAMTLLVPKDQLGRFSGFMHLAGSFSQIVSPLLTGLLLPTIGLASVMALNVPACLAALATLMLVRFPPGAHRAQRAGADAPSHRRELAQAVTYLRGRPGLLLLSGYTAAQHFILAMATVLLTPMILARHSEAELGAIMSAGGVGALAGSLLIIMLGKPHRLMPVMLAGDFLFAATVALTGMAWSVPVLSMLVFATMLSIPVVNSCAQAFWQRKVAPDFQGRVYSLNSMLVMASIPLATLLGSGLVDRLFEPWLLPGGLLADSVGTWLGVGKGRGIGLIFVVAGAAATALTLFAVSRPAFRNLDRNLEDAH